VKRALLIGFGVIAFLVVSGVIARFLSVENTERDADLAVIQAETRGDAAAMLADLHGCSKVPSCVATVKAMAESRYLRRPGAVKILALTSPTAYSLTGASGRTRVAWTVIPDIPVVQCIDVRRTGNALTGINVTLLSISRPIENEGTC
jgi:hypothetical protein